MKNIKNVIKKPKTTNGVNENRFDARSTFCCTA